MVGPQFFCGSGGKLIRSRVMGHKIYAHGQSAFLGIQWADLLDCLGAYPATAGGGRGGGGSGRAVPRCRHIGCVVSHGAAAVSCCVRVIGTCVTCASRATMTRRGGGGGGGASESVPRHVP